MLLASNFAHQNFAHHAFRRTTRDVWCFETVLRLLKSASSIATCLVLIALASSPVTAQVRPQIDYAEDASTTTDSSAAQSDHHVTAREQITTREVPETVVFRSHTPTDAYVETYRVESGETTVYSPPMNSPTEWTPVRQSQQIETPSTNNSGWSSVQATTTYYPSTEQTLPAFSSTVPNTGGATSMLPIPSAPAVPVTTYRPITTYQPVTTYQPITTYRPVTTYQSTTTYRPGTVTPSAPVATVVTPGREVVVRPKFYVRGQPVRNFFRAITP